MQISHFIKRRPFHFICHNFYQVCSLVSWKTTRQLFSTYECCILKSIDWHAPALTHIFENCLQWNWFLSRYRLPCVCNACTIVCTVGAAVAAAAVAVCTKKECEWKMVANGNFSSNSFFGEEINIALFVSPSFLVRSLSLSLSFSL